MAVTEIIALGDQPVTGEIRYVPLAGDGYTAPHSMYIANIDLAQDASGGVIAIRVTRDPRWEHLVGVMAFTNTNTTAAKSQFDITNDASGPFFIVAGTPVTLPGGTQSGVWVPPPIINPQSFNIRAANVDTFTLTYAALIYNFRIDASKRIPLSVLLASVPTGGSLNFS